MFCETSELCLENIGERNDKQKDPETQVRSEIEVKSMVQLQTHKDVHVN